MSRRRASSRSLRACIRTRASVELLDPVTSARRSSSSWRRRSASGAVCPSSCLDVGFETRRARPRRPRSGRARVERRSPSRSCSCSALASVPRIASVSARRAGGLLADPPALLLDPRAGRPPPDGTPPRRRRARASLRSSSATTVGPTSLERVEFRHDRVHPRGPGRPPPASSCARRRLASTARADTSVRRARDPTAWRGTPARRRRAQRRPSARASAAASTSLSSASSCSRAAAAARGPGPSHPATLPLAKQRAQPRGGELARRAVGLGGQRLVLLRQLRLLLQRLQLPAELGQHVGETEQVLVEPGELALGALLAPAVLRDAGGLLDVPAALLGAGQQHLLELSLADDGVQRAPDPRLRQQLLDVEQAGTTWPPMRYSDSPLRKIVRLISISVIGTGILPAGVVDHELDLGHAECRARGRAREDHVGHVAAAERAAPCSPSAQLIASTRLDFPDPFGPTIDRDAGDELQHRLVRERLESTDRDRAEEHRADANRHVILQRGSAPFHYRRWSRPV